MNNPSADAGAKDEAGFTPANDDVRWLLSQHKDRHRPGDDALPPVRASAKVEALNIVEILQRASCVNERGDIVISDWAVHRVALRLADIAEQGLEATDGFGSRRDRLRGGRLTNEGQ